MCKNCERLKEENSGLKEYSTNRDESIAVYRAEITRLTKECDELRILYVEKCIEVRAIREYYEGKDDKTSGLQE